MFAALGASEAARVNGFCHSRMGAASAFAILPHTCVMPPIMSKHLKAPAGQTHATHPSLADRRAKRLEAALRANLKKRKDKGEVPALGEPKTPANQG